ncbi:MAG: beta-lactamase family protein [Chloroflexales bacterium]|nr:beta-lactamase family protein [Chloroflexales bacterium]
MRHLARATGLAICLLVLLTTCSAPRGRGAAISSFVTAATPVLGPTVQPTVTPMSGDAATPALDAPAPPLAAMMAQGPGDPPPPDLRDRAAQMDAYLAGMAQQGGFNGAALVAYRGQILLSRGYGMANREQGTPIAASTRFRLASVTKPLTALGVLRLAARGQVRLDASVCDYLDPCPEAWRPITVSNLLHHSSGLPDYTDFADYPNVEQLPATPDQVVARFRDMGLAFAPGEGYDYCNSNFVLLGLIIERASGRSYADYMRGEIFAPLGMADTGVDPGDFSPLGGTRGYNSGAPDIPVNVSNLYAAGNLYSTVEDLYKLARALDAGTLLPADLTAQMTAPGLGRYGMGWMIEQRGPNRLVYHPGWISGASTWFGRYPDAGVTIVVLSNDYDEYNTVFAIADTLAAQILN